MSGSLGEDDGLHAMSVDEVLAWGKECQASLEKRMEVNRAGLTDGNDAASWAMMQVSVVWAAVIPNLERAIKAERARLRSQREEIGVVRDEMQRADEVTLRSYADTYPEGERKTAADWVAARCEVRAWIAALDAILSN